jgi:hypothetical protein
MVAELEETGDEPIENMSLDELLKYFILSTRPWYDTVSDSQNLILCM